MDEHIERLDPDRLLERIQELLAGRSRSQFEQWFSPPGDGPVGAGAPPGPERPAPPARPDDAVTPRRNFWNRYAALLEPAPPGVVATDPSPSVTVGAAVAEEEEEEEPSDFLRLCEELVEKPPRGWVDCVIEEGELFATTDAVVLDDEYEWCLGEYTVVVMSDLSVYLADRSANDRHPHYSSSNGWCFGSLTPLRTAAVAAGDPGAVLAAVRELLGHYNARDCYYAMGEIDEDYPVQDDEESGEECHNCGSRIAPDDGSYDDGDDLLCGACGGQCADCDRVRRSDDLDECTYQEGRHHCYRMICVDCSGQCPRCDAVLCREHSVVCQHCQEVHCPKHLATCATCALPICPSCDPHHAPGEE